MKVLILSVGIFLSFFGNCYSQNLIEEYISDVNPRVSSWESRAIRQNVLKFSKERALNPILILAIIENESTFNYRATSRNPKKRWQKWSFGLMQINKHVWLTTDHEFNLKTLGIVNNVNDLYNISLNIEAGTFIFTKTQEYCKEWGSQGTLKEKGYSSVFQCTISSYNGDNRVLPNGKRVKDVYFEQVMQTVARIYIETKGNLTAFNDVVFNSDAVALR